MSEEELLELPLIESRREWTRRYVTALLKKTKGNITHAARLAGMERCNFRRVVRRLSVSV